ncbi:MAG: Uncharacterised protein [SAR116 cluster bacterium]|nr:MAG: Uncharacterised protein [SAR116 cluster bacterium]
MHIKIRPQALAGELQIAENGTGIGCRGRHDIMCLGQARAGAVIIGGAVLAQHQPIAHLANRQLQKRVGIDPVQKCSSIPPLDINLAKGGDIADSDR